jgi:two-component system response regulator HupR/HoxA
MPKHNILLVDDQPEILNALDRLLKEKYKVYSSSSGIGALELLKKHTFAVILADQRMPHMTGVEFFRRSLKVQPAAMRILITAYADINASIEAINEGKIFYYISKPWEPEDLLLVVKRAEEQYELQKKNEALTRELREANERLQQENVYLKQSISREHDFSNIIGHSPKMLNVFKLVSKVVNTPTTVLLLGETGTGKEMIARTIHFNGNRKNEMFVAQNCGALPDSLLESELFGHIRGAFTGAIADRKGIFEVADKGTVFLDEIADTSPALQLRLLRVLQEGEIKPVGGNKTKKVDVRIIAATNKNLEEMVQKENFREDLYYRLNVFPIVLPPLRERPEDIPDLVDHFVKKFSQKIGKKINSVSSEVIELLAQAGFPGNIRELENEIERMVTMADSDGNITPDLLSPRFISSQTATQDKHQKESTFKERIESLEKELIQNALKETEGNILHAAKKLKLSRAGLHKKIKRLNIKSKEL